VKGYARAEVGLEVGARTMIEGEEEISYNPFLILFMENKPRPSRQKKPKKMIICI